MEYLFTKEEIRQFAHEIAGRASVPFMIAHPSIVMPTEELIEGVNDMLKDKLGIDPPDDYMNAAETMERE